MVGRHLKPRGKDQGVPRKLLKLFSAPCIVIDTMHCLFKRTFKQDCQAHITVRANENGTALVVKSASFHHNHEVSQVQVACACTCIPGIGMHVHTLTNTSV
jgi:hypothetical protein